MESVCRCLICILTFYSVGTRTMTMTNKIKHKLGSATKKKDRDIYERVGRGGTEGDDENDSKNSADGDRSEASSWALAVTDKVKTDIRRSVLEARHFPPDMHFVFLLKFLESYSYFALSQILVLYLHEDFGVGDVEAGLVYGMWGAAITCGGLLVSWVNDNLGVKISLCIGFSISFVSSIAVALTTSRTLLYIILFAIYPLGTAMGIPMLTVAVKRYTTAKNRGFAFGMYYSVMNVAALVSGPVVDGLYIGLKGRLGNGWSGYRVVVLTCALSNLLSLGVSWRYLREVNIEEEGDDDREAGVTASPLHASNCTEDADVGAGIDTDTNGATDTQQPSMSTRVVRAYTPTQQSPWTTARALCSSKTFWRFSILTLFLVNLHAIFRHLDATLPTYLVRCFGNNVPKGSIYSINPFMIIFLTPLVAALTNTSNHFDMIKWGGFVTAASPFILAVDTSIGAVVGMLIVLSLGEAIWSPRLYDYVMSIAPEGREASFSALASAPLFAAKIPVGLMSGYLLHTYLPEEDDEGEQPVQRPQTMWLIIGLMTITSPVLIALFDPCIREPEGEAPTGEQGDGEEGNSSGCEGEPRCGRLEMGEMNYVEEEDEDE